MISHDIPTHEAALGAPVQFDEERLRAAGRDAARADHAEKHGPRWRGHVGIRPKELNDLISSAASRSKEENGRWLIENVRMLRTALKDIRDLERTLRRYPVITVPSGPAVPRAIVLTHEYLSAVDDHFSEESLLAFLEGYQEVSELDMGELWAIKPALQAVLLERLASQPPGKWPVLVTTLRLIGEATWKHVFEAASLVDRVLARDPAGAYTAMDYDSREAYRKVVTHLAERSGRTEHEVAAEAVFLAEQAAVRSDGSRAAARRAHVGYFLLDRGLQQLRAAVGYRSRWIDRVRDLILANPNAFYLVGVEVVTFIIVIGLLSGLDTLTPVVAGFLLLILPATQAAVEFMNNLTTKLLRPGVLPKLDFSKGIPADCMTMVAVPTLLLNEAQVRDLVLDLEIRFLANRDPNLLFALLTDWPDADQPRDERDALVDVCRGMIEGLNRKYGARGRKPFYLFHRYRVFNPSEGRWMGWERKRGKLHDLNQLLRGEYDSFPIKVGDLSVLRDIRYVITLDSDTQLPRDAAAKLVGAIAHPLNRAVIDPTTRMVVEGYGILQPRIGVSISSASRSRLASLYSGQTGFDIYTRAVSDVYQDLYGEGIFTGKGIYEVDAIRESLGHRFPENALLSHDLIEGAYARAALVSDIELIDDYPSHFSAYSRRKHRWVRGDWQIMRWMFSTVPDFEGRMIPNPISLVSQWKIFDNLRRSLIEPNTLLLFLAGWIYLPGNAAYWTLWTVAMLLMPSCSNLLFAILFAPWKTRKLGAWALDTVVNFVKGVIVAMLGIVFLLHQALLSIDAIVRSILRVFVTKRRLLEWETAAQAEVETRRKARVDMYLDWTPSITVALAGIVFLVRPAALPVAAPVLAAWFLSRAISAWLNRSPKARSHELNTADTELLRDSAERMYRFFRDWSSPATNWLIPDNVREDGAVALRISPTNLGLLLNARIAGVHFGFLSLAEFVSQTRETLATIAKLPKYRGHLLNWYDVETLQPLQPRFVSTVDSGNLVACLWTLKQAALAFASESKTKHGVTAELAEDLTDIARLCEALVEAMDFEFLYNSRKKVLSIGYEIDRQQLAKASYDLLASEARIASFVSIAKNDVPQESWFHLGRGQTLVRGERVLLSWTGTMFEYLMPELWMRRYPDTIMDQSSKAVVRVQRDYGRRKGVPWGISESACSAEEASSDYGYAPFGIPDLAMKPWDRKALVISPYSSFLALGIDSKAAMSNLRAMAEFGWTGRYGFYEAIDYTHAGAEVIRSWMAHHLGMSLLAACNVLFDNQIQRYFHAEPHVMATELLLHERVPSTVAVEVEEPIPDAAAAHA